MLDRGNGLVLLLVSATYCVAPAAPTYTLPNDKLVDDSVGAGDASV